MSETPKSMTVVEFLVCQPLYTTALISAEDHSLFPPGLPERIFAMCAKCGREQPFLNAAAGRPRPATTEGPPKRRYQWEERWNVDEFNFACPGCTLRLDYWVELLRPVMVEQKLVGWAVRKVGQRPPSSIEIKPVVRRALGEDAELYTRARICLNQGYGIGACAYMRRLLENQINPLLEAIHELRQQQRAKPAELNAIKKVIRSHSFDGKLRLANKHAPPELIVEGVNPLTVIFNAFSRGIHQLDEDDAVARASGLLGALDIVIEHLSRVREQRAELKSLIHAAAHKTEVSE